MHEADERARDEAARRDAQQVFDAPLVLEAGAGTGKTATLVARLLAWCLGPGWERWERAAGEASGDAAPAAVAARVLSRVVAITFTEAAAAEMGRRVGAALLEIERGARPLGLHPAVLAAAPDAVGVRARALRGALDQLVSQTIHAYCRRLLVSHPLDAGVHPRLEVDADGRHRAAAAREALDEWIAAGYGQPGDADLRALADRGVGPREIEAELGPLLEQGLDARALAEDPLRPAAVEGLAARLAEAVARFREAGAGRLAEVSSGNAAAVHERIEALHARLAADPPGSGPALLVWLEGLREDWPDYCRNKLGGWAKGNFTRGEAAALGERGEALAEPAAALAALLDHATSLDPERLACAHRVFRRLLERCEARLHERGVATFPSLLDDAARLLREQPRVAAQVRARIDQLLVDEFQDTDRRQCDIVRAIALDGPVERRPGLFVVGDPKQSIYGWRSADLAAYDAFVDDVRAAGGRRLLLTVNHRSAPAVLDEVERVVAPVMRERKSVQPRFERLVPRSEPPDAFAAGRRAPIEYWVSVDRGPAGADGGGGPAPTRAARAAEIEAAALARDLRALRDDHDVAWSRIGVLFRSRGDWEVYLRALRAADVPFAVEGDRSYYRRREIVDATAWVCCALDPNDAVSLVSLLRSSAVGVPDAALLPLWTRGFPGRVAHLGAPNPEALAGARECVAQAAAAVPADVPGIERVRGWELSLCAALEALAELRAHADEPADAFVERLRRTSLLEAVEAARFAGAWRAANLDRFFRELAEDLDAEGADEVLRRLRRALADEQSEEEGRPLEIVDDAVRMLTIHGAKGLDFDHVYLMQLHKGRGGSQDDRVGGIGGDLGYRLLGAQTLDWDRWRATSARVEEAERVRLLYVAMTRARQRLVLAGLWPSLAPGRPARDPMIALLAERSPAAPDLAERMRALARAGADSLDEASARWVFPVLSHASEPDADPGAHAGVVLPGPDEVAAFSARLAAAGERARARAARPFGGAASSPARADEAPEPEDFEERAERLYADASGDESGDGERVRRRGGARAVGTALHRALETIDLAAEPAAEHARLHAGLEADLARRLRGRALERARRDAEQLLERVASGPLLARLRELAPRIVARELPVLATPEPEQGPVGFVSGAIDLVYRDPDSDELVIADYKTDDVAESELAERSREHARQGAAYRRALHDALGLAYEPRFELWYLRLGRIDVA